MEESSIQSPMQSDPQPQLSKKERKVLRRAQKEEERRLQKRNKKTKKFVLWGTLGGVVLALGYFSFALFQDEGIQSPDYSKEMPYEGANHVPEGTAVSYQTNPPTSGSHWPNPLKVGIYDKEKPDEAIIHSLEHGRIWISYKPSIPDQTKQTLKEIAQDHSLVILAPREKNETDVALAAWQRLDAFNLAADGTVEKERVISFIKRYRNKGPENVSGEHNTKTYE